MNLPRNFSSRTLIDLYQKNNLKWKKQVSVGSQDKGRQKLLMENSLTSQVGFQKPSRKGPIQEQYLCNRPNIQILVEWSQMRKNKRNKPRNIQITMIAFQDRSQSPQIEKVLKPYQKLGLWPMSSTRAFSVEWV